MSSPEGCHLTPCSPEEKCYLQPGGPEVVPLPVDALSAQRRAPTGGGQCSPSPPSPAPLDRGLLLWMGPDGLYARRLCQSRVYWQGALSQYGDKPSKLEREVNCKLLHTQDCLTGEAAARRRSAEGFQSPDTSAGKSTRESFLLEVKVRKPQYSDVLLVDGSITGLIASISV